MFNEERKQKYIQYKKENFISPSANHWENTFELGEKYEIEWKKDLCSFSPSEIITMYKELGYTSVQMLKNLNSTYSTYTDWCIQKGYTDDQQNYYKMTSSTEMLRECVNVTWVKESYITKEKIIEICDYALIRNDVEKFVLLGLYEGLCGPHYSDLINAERSDFNADELTYTASEGRIFHISKRLYDFAEDAWKAKEWVTPKGRIERYKIEDEHCIKSGKGTIRRDGNDKDRMVYGIAKIRKILGNIFDVYEKNGLSLGTVLKPRDIYKAGMLNYLHENAESKGYTSFEDYVYSPDFGPDMEYRHYNLLNKKDLITKYAMIFSE